MQCMPRRDARLGACSHPTTSWVSLGVCFSALLGGYCMQGESAWSFDIRWAVCEDERRSFGDLVNGRANQTEGGLPIGPGLVFGCSSQGLGCFEFIDSGLLVEPACRSIRPEERNSGGYSQSHGESSVWKEHVGLWTGGSKGQYRSRPKPRLKSRIVSEPDGGPWRLGGSAGPGPESGRL
ncbi:hypothetical protein GGTG_04915 [Gaeumannomyces tritici R3-111a-1]|uniref:Uncharacterized protein n=1 Tax=Gaeumannomyces tritici (strain R3-111a-1) TaxID=644352 RepID=J3NUF9_GAET3|nr:hypothetical protein GGTG_04915 [Gaeumannomyces tritici R3-111a-1]EJT79832.1 hypothetical protein GGTG_04915 [Gaeumannomyces tritici R3-111a-1]